METVKIGVIGGSGLYQMPEVTDTVEYDIDTPFGKPSAPLLVGTLSGKRVAFVPRHGKGHVYSPTTLPYQANIYALKTLGVRFVISVNAVGSLQEQYAPGHIVIPDQLYDNTKSDRGGRSFFGTGLVGHISVADPMNPELSTILHDAVQNAGGTSHHGGLLVVIEGPRFSTKGESRIFRSWGGDIIGMTSCPEAFLAIEAEMAYAAMTHVTDYDVWHETEEPVTVEMVIETMNKNIQTAQKALAIAVAQLDPNSDLPVHHGLKNALMTAPDRIDPAMRQNLSAIVGPYLG